MTPPDLSRGTIPAHIPHPSLWRDWSETFGFSVVVIVFALIAIGV